MNRTSRSTRSIVLSGVFIATSIVLTRFFAFMLMGGTIRLSIGAVPIVMAGAMLGPVYGGLVGIVADVVGVMLFPQGTPFPGFTLSSMLQGVIPGLLVYKTFLDANAPRKRLTTMIVLSTVCSVLIVSFGLNTLWLSMLMNKAFMALLPTRLISGTVVGITEVAILTTLLNMLKGKL